MSELSGVTRRSSVTFLQVGDATCALPMRLSEIGMETPDCTEVVSELQMEAMGMGRGGGDRCGADAQSLDGPELSSSARIL